MNLIMNLIFTASKIWPESKISVDFIIILLFDRGSAAD